jgi:hypothetical protein
MNCRPDTCWFQNEDFRCKIAPEEKSKTIHYKMLQALFILSSLNPQDPVESLRRPQVPVEILGCDLWTVNCHLNSDLE